MIMRPLVLLFLCLANGLNSHAQDLNTLVKGNGVPVLLLGSCSRDALLAEPFRDDFAVVHQELDPALRDSLREALQGCSLLLFLGTWCSDSHEQVPRLFNVLDQCAAAQGPSPGFHISLECLDELKRSPSGLETIYGITNVPTLIVMKDEEEIGRIVELPMPSWEEELWGMLKP